MNKSRRQYRFDLFIKININVYWTTCLIDSESQRLRTEFILNTLDVSVVWERVWVVSAIIKYALGLRRRDRRRNVRRRRPVSDTPARAPIVRRTTHTRLLFLVRTPNKLTPHKRSWAALAHRDLWPPPHLRGHMKAQTGPATIVQREYSLTALEYLIDT